MYQALYRRYRPATFDDVIGQDIIIRTLKNAIVNNKLSHAYLFTGPRGTGKTSTAKILAKTINCENLNGFKPCNMCDSCIQINNKQTTDIIEIDAASNNGVDEIRELKNKVNLVASNSKYKIYIIDEVHMLSTGAFNALLKTLEEPPSHIIFILATTEPHKIPATILSRCQRFDFKKISENKIIENLKKIIEQENIIIEEEALREIAVLSQGGMRDSISLLDQSISYCSENITCKDIHDINGTIGFEKMNEIVQLIINQNITILLKTFDELDASGKNLIKLIEKLIYFLKNILIYQTAPEYFELEEQKKYQRLDYQIDNSILLKYIKHFSKTVYEMKNSDNEKITLEIYLIEIMHLNQKNVNNLNENIEKQTIEIKKTIVNDTQNKEMTENFDSSEKENKETVKLVSNVKKNGALHKIKIVRIENTLSCFNKKLLFDYKKSIESVRKYLIDEKYSQWVSLILDGELKAVGKNILIFVYKDEPMEELFNQNWLIIEEILGKLYHENIKVVATNINDWNQIRTEFNSRTKQYKWREEPILNEISEEIAEDKNEIEKIFQEIIEYSSE